MAFLSMSRIIYESRFQWDQWTLVFFNIKKETQLNETFI